MRRPRILVALVALVVAGASVVAVTVWRDRRASPAPVADGAPHFVNETLSAGVDHSYSGGFEFFVGGGVAAFDCDGDGFDELFFAGGSEPAALFRNESEIGGELSFSEQGSPVTALTEVTGAYPLDVDSDRHVDLVVLRRGGNVVLRGLGDCAFEDANDQFGLERGDDWTVAFSATWEADNVLPTMAFGSYLVPDGGTTCSESWLVRPAAVGARYDSPIALTPGYCTLSVLFSDWSRSGQRDLRMANDRHYYIGGSEQLWRIPPGEKPRLYTEADGWKPLKIWGMGIASQDLTGDGYPEVFITSQSDNKLQTLADGPARPTYDDIAFERGVITHMPYTGGDELPSTAWHAQFEDVNNDGFFDLFISKGNVEAQVDSAMRDPSNLLIGQVDGTFVEGAPEAGVVSFDRARGATLVDLNLDGMLDLVVVNRETNVAVWRNVGHGDVKRPRPMGHWLELQVQQAVPNVDAIGAWVEVQFGGRTVAREVTVGGGHASGQIGWIHVGLGEAVSAEVRVRWPNGEVGPWMTFGADQFLTIKRGEAAPRRWKPGQNVSP